MILISKLIRFFKRVFSFLKIGRFKDRRYRVPYEEKGIAVNKVTQEDLDRLGRQGSNYDRQLKKEVTRSLQVIRNRRNGVTMIIPEYGIENYRDKSEEWEVVNSINKD